MAKETPVIKTELLTKYYGKTRGIENLSLEIDKGEVFGLLGPNGAGKTTTIRLLLGLIYPTRGKAQVLGKEIDRGQFSIRNEIGYIPGDVVFYPNLSGRYLLGYFSRFKPDKPPKLKDELVERFDLDLAKRVREYSRGNRQKLAIVLALMHDPRLLILDEPTLGLDPMMQREFYKVLREFKSRGATVFLSSHILSEVERVCDRVAVVREGKLTVVEDVGGIKSKALHHVEVTFAEDVKPGFFDLRGVTSLEKHDRTFRLVFKGELDPLIKTIAKARVIDVEVIHPSLEEIFFEFYEKKEKT